MQLQSDACKCEVLFISIIFAHLQNGELVRFLKMTKVIEFIFCKHKFLIYNCVWCGGGGVVYKRILIYASASTSAAPSSFTLVSLAFDQSGFFCG